MWIWRIYLVLPISLLILCLRTVRWVTSPPSPLHTLALWVKLIQNEPFLLPGDPAWAFNTVSMTQYRPNKIVGLSSAASKPGICSSSLAIPRGHLLPGEGCVSYMQILVCSEEASIIVGLNSNLAQVGISWGGSFSWGVVLMALTESPPKSGWYLLQTD